MVEASNFARAPPSTSMGSITTTGHCADTQTSRQGGDTRPSVVWWPTRASDVSRSWAAGAGTRTSSPSPETLGSGPSRYRRPCDRARGARGCERVGLRGGDCRPCKCPACATRALASKPSLRPLGRGSGGAGRAIAGSGGCHSPTLGLVPQVSVCEASGMTCKGRAPQVGRRRRLVSERSCFFVLGREGCGPRMRRQVCCAWAASARLAWMQVFRGRRGQTRVDRHGRGAACIEQALCRRWWHSRRLRRPARLSASGP